MTKILIVCLVLSLSVITSNLLAQEQAPAPTADKPAPASNLTIARMEIAGGVENREPVGIAASFPASQEKVYCFLEFKDVAAESSVTVVWTLGQNEKGKVPLAIKPYSKFRTWAYKTIGGLKGEWKVDVIDSSGTVLKSATFKIE